MSIEIKTASANLIGLEARANPFTMINPQIKENLLNLTTNVTTTLSSVSKSLFQTKVNNGLRLDISAARKTMGRHEYLDVRVVKVPVPAGFNGRYLEYVTLLDKTFDDLGDLVDDVLTPVAEALSLLIAHPERATGVTSDKLLSTITYPTQAMDDFTTKTNTFFVKNATEEAQPFGNLFERNADMITFIEQAVTLSKVYDKRDTTLIIAKIAYLNEVSDLLYVRLKNGQLTEVQNKQADMAAQMLSQAARCVEIYAALCVLIEQLFAYAAQVYNHVVKVLN